MVVDGTEVLMQVVGVLTGLGLLAAQPLEAPLRHGTDCVVVVEGTVLLPALGGAPPGKPLQVRRACV